MPHKIIFSIIIPTYNRANFIKKTIQSVLSQTYTNFEIIVVDDGSTDNTEDVVKAIKDTRLFYYKKENAERSVARNFGAKKAKGDYLNFFDSDDLAYPNHLQAAFNFIRANHNPSVFHQNYDEKNKNGKTVRTSTPIIDIKRQLTGGNLLAVLGVFLKKDIALQNPFHENRVLIGSEDYFLWIQLASKYDFLINPETTSAYIYHSDNSVLNFSKDELINRKKFMIECVLKDEEIMKSYGNTINKIKSSAHFYVALHLAMSNEKRLAIEYVKRGIREDFSILFTKKFLAILKQFLR